MWKLFKRNVEGPCVYSLYRSLLSMQRIENSKLKAELDAVARRETAALNRNEALCTTITALECKVKRLEYKARKLEVENGSLMSDVAEDNAVLKSQLAKAQAQAEDKEGSCDDGRCCQCLDMLKKIAEENEVLKSELAEAQAWYIKVKEGGFVTLTCAYCGENYPEGTPAAKSTSLYEHIRKCKKHPLKKYIDFVKWIDQHIVKTSNMGHVWVNLTEETVKEKCQELLE